MVYLLCRYGSGGVSWTASGGEYYIQRIDRSQLAKFVESQNDAKRTKRK